MTTAILEAAPMVVPPQGAAPDYAAIKAKQNAAWASGDYARVGVTLQLAGELLAETMDLPHDARVLDVAAGNGNATMALARRGAAVTSTDYVRALLDKGAARAAAEGLRVTFRPADAEALPFADASFDAVASTFGVMFAPNQAQAAGEMMRVCRPGGVIGMANWTPDSFIGALFNAVSAHVPAPPGVASPALWGDEAWLRDTFAGAASIRIRPREFVFRYRSALHFIAEFRDFYGPVHKAFAAAGPHRANALERDLLAVAARFNRATDGSLRAVSRYAEIVIDKG